VGAFAERLWNSNSSLTEKELVNVLLKLKKDLAERDIVSAPLSSQFCEMYTDFCFFNP
jgi:hypothetical protein